LTLPGRLISVMLLAPGIFGLIIHIDIENVFIIYNINWETRSAIASSL